MPSNMEFKRISASPAPATGVREATQVAKLIDTTTCIGCKACEVACQEWNDLLGIDEVAGPAHIEFGSYQTQPDLLQRARREERRRRREPPLADGERPGPALRRAGLFGGLPVSGGDRPVCQRHRGLPAGELYRL